MKPELSNISFKYDNLTSKKISPHIYHVSLKKDSKSIIIFFIIDNAMKKNKQPDLNQNKHGIQGCII